MPTINIEKDFSKFPGGRFRRDGDHSGQHFREDVLLPAFATEGDVIIELDGTLGYGSSFLGGGFEKLTKEQRERIKLVGSNEGLITTIKEIMVGLGL